MKKSIYVKIFENKIEMKCVNNGRTTEKYGVFSTSRLGIADFDIALNLLKSGISEVYSIPKFILPPIVIMHQIPFSESGLSPVEKRVLTELGLMIGGNPVYYWQGKALTDSEILSKYYLEANQYDEKN